MTEGGDRLTHGTIFIGGCTIAAAIVGSLILVGPQLAPKELLESRLEGDVTFVEDGPYLRTVLSFRNLGSAIALLKTVDYSVDQVWYFENPNCSIRDAPPGPPIQVVLSLSPGDHKRTYGLFSPVRPNDYSTVTTNLSTTAWDPLVLPAFLLTVTVDYDDSSTLVLGRSVLLTEPYGYRIRYWFDEMEGACDFASKEAFESAARSSQALASGIREDGFPWGSRFSDFLKRLSWAAER